MFRLIPFMLCLFFLFAHANAEPVPQKNGGVLIDERVSWLLKNPRVVQQPSEVTGKNGTFTDNYVIEADAEDSLGRISLFHIALTLFSPAYDLPGQKAGLFYFQGEFTITPAGTRTASPARHSSKVYRGKILAELDFDPIHENGTIFAKARLPGNGSQTTWTESIGSFDGNQLFEGILTLDLKRWPSAKNRGQR